METNKSGIKDSDFDRIIDGKAVKLLTLTNKSGMEVSITNYGCALVAIMVPDRKGAYDNVLLSQGSIEGLISSPEPFLSTIIGRYANRICKGAFSLDGKAYNLAINNGPNALHGGPGGFHCQVWDIIDSGSSHARLQYISHDMEEGYPGNLTVSITFTLTDDNGLVILYEATTDKPTIVNLTSHGFFNLSGTGNPTTDVLDHIVSIKASHYLPIDATSIPNGEIRSVKGTPFDFLEEHSVGERINDNDEQILNGKGYDHCFVLDKHQAEEFSLAATCRDSHSGREMRVYTTEPGLQVYTGNWLSGFEGANKATFPERSAICFEAQKFPDTPNQAYFPSAILRPGEIYHQKTEYRFSVTG